MKLIFIVTLLTASIISCKNDREIDKDLLVSNVCKSFQNDTITEPDSVKIFRIFKNHLSKLEHEIPADSLLALSDFLYIRLQKECPKFYQLANRISLKEKIEKSDWRDVADEPTSKLTDADYDLFIKLRVFKYLEPNGDPVTTYITNSTWEDHFLDGTYSRLSLKKLSQNEFVITFLESNNRMRKNLSKPGDKYRYKILQKAPGYYLMFTQPFESKTKSLFKLYY